MTHFEAQKNSEPGIHQPSKNRRVLSVQQLNRRARQILEQLPLVWVEGEISNLSTPASGHIYFSLKDSQAQIRCALFRQKSIALPFRPQDGHKVVVRGQLSLFEGRGDYQLIIEHMELAGSGALQQQLEALKHKLQTEGLLDSQYKQAIPRHPLHIGVITSPSGAAIRDVLTVLQRRCPSIPVTIVPTSVQGQFAPSEIIRAIKLAEMSGLFDVLLITRGGGSLEDLWAFNNEQVARAIAACPIPIVSAVGHETDITITDWVADYRAPTPSAGAELLSPDRSAISKQLQEYNRQLFNRLVQRISQSTQQLMHLRKRLRHPQDRLRQQTQTLDLLEMRLRNAIQTQLQTSHSKQAQLQNALALSAPSQKIASLQQRLSICVDRLPNLCNQQLNAKQQAFQGLLQRMNSVNPLAVLERGYAIAYREVTDKKNTPPTVVTKAKSLKKGDSLRIKLSEGEVLCDVNTVLTKNESTK